jgi:hypothetical protein
VLFLTGSRPGFEASADLFDFTVYEPCVLCDADEFWGILEHSRRYVDEQDPAHMLSEMLKQAGLAMTPAVTTVIKNFFEYMNQVQNSGYAHGIQEFKHEKTRRPTRLAVSKPSERQGAKSGKIPEARGEWVTGEYGVLARTSGELTISVPLWWLVIC